MTTSPGRTGDGVLDFNQDWSAFIGSGEEISLNRNIVIPSGKTLTLEPNLFIDMNGKSLRSTAGTISANTTASVTVLSAEAQKASINVTWQALSPAPGYYFIRYGTSSGSYIRYEVVDNAATSKVISPLTNGTQYYFRVNGSSEFTNIPSSCRSNYNGNDQVINFDDFFRYVDHFGETPSDPTYEQQYDLSGNEEVDNADTELFTSDFGKNCTAVPKVLFVAHQEGKNINARPQAKVQSVGENLLSVDITLQNAEELTGYGLHLEYDPDVLVFQRFSDNGSILRRHGREALLDVSLQEPGHLKYGSALKKGYRVKGSGLLARVQFRVMGAYEGQAPVQLRELTLSDVQRRVNRPISQRLENRQSTDTAALSAGPNPFNPSTTIRFNLSQPMAVTLEIYDMLGQRVNTLISNEYRQAGGYTVVWDGHDLSGKRTASGVYLIHLRAGDRVYKAKLTLMH